MPKFSYPAAQERRSGGSAATRVASRQVAQIDPVRLGMSTAMYRRDIVAVGERWSGIRAHSILPRSTFFELQQVAVEVEFDDRRLAHRVRPL